MKRTILLTVMLMVCVSFTTAKSYDDGGVTISTQKGDLRIIPLTDNAVRIKLCPQNTPELDELIYIMLQ